MKSRIPYLNADDLAEADRDLLRSPINLRRGLANHPEAMRVFAPIGPWMQNGMRLDGRLREMAILQVAYVLRNAYEFSHHLKLGKDDVSEADIWAIIAETTGQPTTLSALDKAVLEAARTLTLDLAISDACWATLKKDLGKERAMEVVLTIAYYNHLARVIAAFRFEVEPDYAKLMPPYSAYGGGEWR